MPVDQQHEFKRIKRILAVAAVLIVATFMVWSEIAYLIWGAKATATATVTKSFESSGRRGERNDNIEFTFTEAGGRFRKDIITTLANGNRPDVGQSIEIQYTPGELGRSRRAGQIGWPWIAIFVAAIIVFVVFVVLMVKESRQIRPMRRRQ